MKREAGVCPLCGHDDLEYGTLVDEGLGDVYYEIYCSNCNTHGYEYYNLIYATTIMSTEETAEDE